MQLPAEIRQAFELLELQPTWQSDQLKLAFRRRMKSVHPDLNPDSEVSVHAVVDAYETILVYIKTRKRFNPDFDLESTAAAQPDSGLEKLSEYISVYRVLLKKYTRRLSAHKFDLLTDDSRVVVLKELVRLQAAHPDLNDFPEFQTLKALLQGLLYYHRLPLEVRVTNVAGRQAYNQYRLILRNVTWVLEELFASLHPSRRRNAIWKDYYEQAEEGLDRFASLGDTTLYPMLSFMPGFLVSIYNAAALFATHRSILSYNDYFRLSGRPVYPAF